MYRDDTTWAPFLLFQYESGDGYSLILSDGKMGPCEAPLAAAGRDPGGYTWADIAVHLMRSQAPGLPGRLGLDPEAGMFCAYGKDLEALQRLAGLLHGVFHDPKALEAVAKAAPWEYD